MSHGFLFTLIYNYPHHFACRVKQRFGPVRFILRDIFR